jgi:hypothetical protein
VPVGGGGGVNIVLIYLRAYGRFAAAFLGSLLVGMGLSALVLPSSGTAASPSSAGGFAFTAAACGDCTGAVAIRSVEVQKRSGSTLFVLGGNWPSTVDALGTTGVHHVAGSVEVRLRPHGSQNAFELATATTAGQAMRPGSVAAGISGPYLLISVKGLQAPLQFHVALTGGAADHDRVPALGELSWDGRSKPVATAPQLAQASPSASAPASAAPQAVATPTSVAAPTATTPSGGVDFLGFVEACGATIPTASFAPELGIVATAAGQAPEPGDSVVTPYVDVTLAGPLPSSTVQRAPFVIVVAVQPAGSHAGPGATAIDGAGSTQLFVSWDGAQFQGLLRQRTGSGPWVQQHTRFGLTYGGSRMRIFWTGFTPGSTIAAVTANPQGCAFKQVG